MTAIVFASDPPTRPDSSSVSMLRRGEKKGNKGGGGEREKGREIGTRHCSLPFSLSRKKERGRRRYEKIRLVSIDPPLHTHSPIYF